MALGVRPMALRVAWLAFLVGLLLGLGPPARAQTPAPDAVVTKITTIKAPGGRVSWSHASDLIAFDKSAKESDEKQNTYYDIYSMRPDGSAEVCLTCGGSKSWAVKPQKHMWQPVWHPSGEFIALQAEMETHPATSDTAAPPLGLYNNLWVMTSDGTQYLRLTDLPAVTATGSTGILHPVFSSDGSLLAWAERLGAGGLMGEYVLRVADFAVSLDAQGQLSGGLTNVRTFQLRPGTFHEPHDFTADGAQLLFAANLEDGQPATAMDIYALDLATGTVVDLTMQVPDWWEELPVCTPDGSQIAFISSSGLAFTSSTWQSTLRTEYWLMRADGTGKRQVTYFNDPSSWQFTGKRTVASDGSWSPDGTRLAALIFEDDGTVQSQRIAILEFGPPTLSVALLTDKSGYTSGVDTTAVVTATVSDEIGHPVADLTESAFATTLDAVPILLAFAATGVAGTYEAVLDLATVPNGTHPLTTTVTDDRGVIGSGTVTVSLGATAPALTVTVASDKTSYTRNETAAITVQVTAGNGPVAGAAVHLVITTANGKLKPFDGSTDASGMATFLYRINPKTDGAGLYAVSATASASGFISGSASSSFSAN